MQQPALSNLTVQRRDIDSGDAITADEAIMEIGSDHIQLPELASIAVADTNIRYTRLFWTLADEIHDADTVDVSYAGSPSLAAVCWYRRLKGGVSDAGVLDVFGLDLGAALPVGHVLEGSELSQSVVGGAAGAGRRFQTEPVGVTVRARPQITSQVPEIPEIPEIGAASAEETPRNRSLRFDHWRVIGDESGLHVDGLTLDAEPGVSALAIAVYRATGASASAPRRQFEVGANQEDGQHHGHGLGAWIAGRLRGSRQSLGKPE